MVTAKDIGINLCFFIYNDVIAYNKHYTLTLSNILTKIFSWLGEENEGKKVLNLLLLMWNYVFKSCCNASCKGNECKTYLVNN